MNILKQIELAFSTSRLPLVLIDKSSPVTSDDDDALWFTGRAWGSVDWQDWERHSASFYAFAPSAFIYYLPSVLSCTISAPYGPLQVCGSLLTVLNRSPEIDLWDDFLTARLLGLTALQYEVTGAWILSLSGLPWVDDEDELVRAYQTLTLLAQETSRRGASPTP